MTCRCGGQCSLRKKKTMTQIRVVYQCEECLRCTNAPNRMVIEMGPEAREALPWWRRKIRKRPNSRKREYQRVLQSPRWKKLRKEVLERDEGVCQLNLWGCVGKATEVHHLTYDRLGYERLSDLAASCGPCNRREAEERITRHVLGPIEGAS